MNDHIPSNHRVLIVDDNDAIHKDFRKILGSESARGGLASLESALFGDTPSSPSPGRPPMQVDSALQGGVFVG